MRPVTLLSLANSARPIAVIVIIAAAIALFIIEPARRSRKTASAALALGCLLAALLAGNAANDALFTARVGEEPAGTPGFSVLVGFNQETNGQWSEADSALLTECSGQPGLSARDVQDIMLGEALERIGSGGIDFPRLMLGKLSVLLGRDDAAVDYARSALTHTQLLSALCDAYYLTVWILAALGMLALLLSRSRSLMYIFPLYAVGLAMAHMAVEVAPRYHYSMLFCLALLAGHGLSALGAASVRRGAAARS